MKRRNIDKPERSERWLRISQAMNGVNCNHLNEPYTIKVGQELAIPGKMEGFYADELDGDGYIFMADNQKKEVSLPSWGWGDHFLDNILDFRSIMPENRLLVLFSRSVVTILIMTVIISNILSSVVVLGASACLPETMNKKFC